MSGALEPYEQPEEEVWDEDDEEDDAVDSLLLGGNAENEALDKEVSCVQYDHHPALLSVDHRYIL